MSNNKWLNKLDVPIRQDNMQSFKTVLLGTMEKAVFLFSKFSFSCMLSFIISVT